MSTINMTQHLKGHVGSSSRSRTPRPSKHFFSPCIHYGFNDHLSDDCVNYPIFNICGSYDHDAYGHNRIISLRRGVKPRNPQHVMKSYETCGSIVHTTTDHNDTEWFRRGEALQAKKSEALKLNKAETTNANRSKTPTKSRCSRHMTGVKSCLHKYAEQPGPKVVFGDDSTCTTEGYGSLFNLILLAKQNLVIGLPLFVYSKDKPCLSCEKGKHHRANFKTKQTSSIKKCLYLLHIDLFRPVTPRSINHEKYTLVIVDEYSRYTEVYFLKKKSQAPEIIMSFIKRVENQNDIKVKQLRTDNGTEFRNSILINFCDEKGISQNFSSPYTPKQNGVAERENRTLIEVARTMLLGSRIPNIDFLHVFGCPVFIHNHKDHLGKFDEKADGGYFLGYSLVSKAFRVFNTRRQQTKETYHITFDTLMLSNSQNLELTISTLLNLKDIYLMNIFILMSLLKANQNDQSAQTNKILNNDQSKHSNHTNDEQIIDNLPSTKGIQISEHLSSPNVEDTSVQDTTPIPNPSLSVPSMTSPAPQDRWSQDKHIDLVNIIGDPEAGMLTQAMAKELSTTSTHECLFVDFLSEKEPKKVSEALKHPGWVDAMQDELNQFSRNKV
ncbi:retrovirus-related pol polyprotein from transposon TNT 1-94 [Tanacetum coccineum]